MTDRIPTLPGYGSMSDTLSAPIAELDKGNGAYWTDADDAAYEAQEASRINNRILDECSAELAMNFDVPAERIIGIYACKLGITPDAVKQLLCDRITD